MNTVELLSKMETLKEEIQSLETQLSAKRNEARTYADQYMKAQSSLLASLGIGAEQKRRGRPPAWVTQTQSSPAAQRAPRSIESRFMTSLTRAFNHAEVKTADELATLLNSAAKRVADKNSVPVPVEITAWIAEKVAVMKKRK